MISIVTPLQAKWLSSPNEDTGIIWSLEDHLDHNNQTPYADDYCEPLWLTLRKYPSLR